MNNINKEEAIRLIGQLLEGAGISFRPKDESEEGGIFLIDDGGKTKFTENIFVKRSMKYDESLFQPDIISINDICGDGNESEPNIVNELNYNVTSQDDITLNSDNWDIPLDSREMVDTISHNQYYTFDSVSLLILEAA